MGATPQDGVPRAIARWVRPPRTVGGGPTRPAKGIRTGPRALPLWPWTHREAPRGAVLWPCAHSEETPLDARAPHPPAGLLELWGCAHPPPDPLARAGAWCRLWPYAHFACGLVPTSTVAPRPPGLWPWTHRRYGPAPTGACGPAPTLTVALHPPRPVAPRPPVSSVGRLRRNCVAGQLSPIGAEDDDHSPAQTHALLGVVERGAVATKRDCRGTLTRARHFPGTSGFTVPDEEGPRQGVDAGHPGYATRSRVGDSPSRTHRQSSTSPRCSTRETRHRVAKRQKTMRPTQPPSRGRSRCSVAR